MQKKYSIEIIDGIISIRIFERLNLSLAIEMMKMIAVRGAFRRRLWVLEAGINLSNDEIEQLGQEGKKTWATPSKAAIVASDDLSYGILRIHDVYREQEDHETNTFRSEEEALAWLKIE